MLHVVEEVGVRELRNKLNRYLDRVRNGEELVVTNRGRAIARVLPVDGERVLDRLIAAGIVSPARQPKRRAGRPITTKGSVSELGERYLQLDLVEIDQELAFRAGELAETHGLRGQDAVHLAAADALRDPDLVVVAGDGALLTAAGKEGLATAPIG